MRFQYCGRSGTTRGPSTFLPSRRSRLQLCNRLRAHSPSIHVNLLRVRVSPARDQRLAAGTKLQQLRPQTLAPVLSSAIRSWQSGAA